MNFSDLSDYVISHAKDWLKLKLVVALVALFLFVFAVGIFHPSVLFLRPDSELTYTEQMRSLICMQKYGICSMRYELVLGNTGKVNLDKVVVIINNLPQSMTLDQQRVTPLTALNNRDYGAGIKEIEPGDKRGFEISGFKAGTVIEIAFEDIKLPYEDAMLLQDSKKFVSISTEAHVVNSDPRLTVVGRMIESNM